MYYPPTLVDVMSLDLSLQYVTTMMYKPTDDDGA